MKFMIHINLFRFWLLFPHTFLSRFCLMLENAKINIYLSMIVLFEDLEESVVEPNLDPNPMTLINNPVQYMEAHKKRGDINKIILRACNKSINCFSIGNYVKGL